jgi:hypothetical protein
MSWVFTEQTFSVVASLILLNRRYVVGPQRHAEHGTTRSRSRPRPAIPWVVGLEIGLKNQEGDEGTPGEASVVLLRRNGPVVPYPFDPGVLGAAGA